MGNCQHAPESYRKEKSSSTHWHTTPRAGPFHFQACHLWQRWEFGPMVRLESGAPQVPFSDSCRTMTWVIWLKQRIFFEAGMPGHGPKDGPTMSFTLQKSTFRLMGLQTQAHTQVSAQVPLHVQLRPARVSKNHAFLQLTWITWLKFRSLIYGSCINLLKGLQASCPTLTLMQNTSFLHF